jgi:hypothetical protein
MHVHDSPRIIAQVPTALLAQNSATVARETIVDSSSTERAARRKQRNAAAMRAHRAALGAAPHASSAARTKPWAVIGISKRTWYRKKKAAASRRLMHMPVVS